MVTMKSTQCVALLLLAVFVVGSHCFETIDADDNSTEPCSTGTACFQDGVLPEGVSDTDPSFYCCLAKNMSATARRNSDKTYNCTCRLDLTLDSKILNWAEQSKDEGRMCAREQDCEKADVKSTINERYRYCCGLAGSDNLTNISANVTIFAGDKEEYIGCRCSGEFGPHPPPHAYIVPPVPLYNSTDESCSYDDGCQALPSLKCRDSDVTFCCYGSRGLVTANEGERYTGCTCTNELYGVHCEDRPIAIADSVLPCLTECSDKQGNDTCVIDNGDDNNDDVRCCPYNLKVVASQTAGNFTSCECRVQTSKDCGNKGTTSTPSPASSSLRHLANLNYVILIVLCLLYIL